MPESTNDPITLEIVFTDINGDEIARTILKIPEKEIPKLRGEVAAVIRGFKYFGKISQIDLVSFNSYYVIARIFGVPTPQAGAK